MKSVDFSVAPHVSAGRGAADATTRQGLFTSELWSWKGVNERASSRPQISSKAYGGAGLRTCRR